MTQISVGYLVTRLQIGGAERQILALAAGLPRDRFRAEILSLSGAGPLDGYASAHGIPVRFVGSGSFSGAPLPTRVAGRVNKILRYVNEARRRRFDIIDAWLYPEDVLAVLTRFATRRPIVLSGRVDILPRTRAPLVRAVADAAINRFADMIVANSEAAAVHAMSTHRVHPDKVRIIRNGVAPIDPPTEGERRAARAALGAADAEILIGCVGNYRPMKGQLLLIDAFASLARSRSDLRLVLVGDGPMRSDIERRVVALGLDHLVRVHGSVLDPRPLYGAFDLVVQASNSEGLPNVLLEAAAAGRPIVATAAGGSGEVVIDGQTGLLIPIDDVDALAAGMQRAIDDPDLRKRLGAAARRHIATTFGMDRFVREWAELYEDLWKTRHGSAGSG